jgi:hypothetical protein
LLSLVQTQLTLHTSVAYFKTELLRIIITYALIPVFFIFISCGSGMTGVKSSDFKNIDSNFSGTFKNLSYKNARKHSSGYIFDDLGILNLFEIKNKNLDSINLSFVNDHSLLIKYSDSTGTRTKKFSGKFTKRGFFEIYFRKQNVQIPPLFPIIYSKTNVDRIRISLSSNNDLLIDDYSARGGNIFILAGGGNSSAIYYFERIKK